MITNISSIFKEIRKKNNVTQKEFADKLNVSRSAIAQIEIGNNKPSIELLDEIFNNFFVNGEQKDYLLKNVGVNAGKNAGANKVTNKHFKKTTNIDPSEINRNNEELLNLHSKYMSIIDTIDKILQILVTHTDYSTTDKVEIDTLNQLTELAINNNPIHIILGKSKISISEYRENLKINILYAEKILNEYIDVLYLRINNLKEGEQLYFSYENLLPPEPLEFPDFKWTKEDSIKVIKNYLNNKNVVYTEKDLESIYKQLDLE